MKKNDIPKAGIISIRNWMKTSDGDQHNAFWCARWRLITNKEAGLDNIKSSDKWSAIAYSHTGRILAIIPGCEVTGYIVGSMPPHSVCILQ